jgi:hypothetical protein
MLLKLPLLLKMTARTTIRQQQTKRTARTITRIQIQVLLFLGAGGGVEGRPKSTGVEGGTAGGGSEGGTKDGGSAGGTKDGCSVEGVEDTGGTGGMDEASNDWIVASLGLAKLGSQAGGSCCQLGLGLLSLIKNLQFKIDEIVLTLILT